MKSPIPWMGGKSRLAKQIIGLIPEHSHYGEVFAGGAWVFFGKPESPYESINDLNSDLVALYRVLQFHVEEFCRQFKFMLSSREWFQDWDRQLAAGGLTDIQRAARFYYLQRHSFSAKINRHDFGRNTNRPPRINLVRLEEELSAVHLRMARVTVECLPYLQYIDRYDAPTTFFYADPPYFGFEDIYGRGLFSPEDFTRLADRLAALQGKFLLSINDVPEIRETFKAFRIRTVQTTYCSRKPGNTSVRELLIGNFK